MLASVIISAVGAAADRRPAGGVGGRRDLGFRSPAFCLGAGVVEEETESACGSGTRVGVGVRTGV